MDLHPGIHGSLLATPPAGYRYLARDAEHVFLHSRGRRPFSPVHQGHWAELVRFGAGDELVHSASWPVLGRRHWVVELDDFGYPAYVGRHALSARFRRSFEQAWTEALTRDMRLRTECLVRAYTHQSCGAVIFMTLAAARGACDALVQLGLETWIEPLLAKAVVVFPAAPAMPAGEIARKWHRPRRLKLLFCGRDFHAKDGALCLDVVRRLLARGHDVDFTYVGDIPASARHRFRDVLARVRVLESLPRPSVLALMKDAHVLFHPSPNESVGMVFIEAAAAGLAVVASEGPGLAHLHELLPSRGAMSVDRGRGSPIECERRFAAIFDALLCSWTRARVMGLSNHRRALDGPISVRRRNEALASVYDATLRRSGSQSLCVEDLAPRRTWVSSRIGDRRLRRMIDNASRSSARTSFTICAGTPWPSHGTGRIRRSQRRTIASGSPSKSVSAVTSRAP
jgi:glycosyl transferase family 1